nr:hypothetical protein [Tanacetum cinerariifolium]
MVDNSKKVLGYEKYNVVPPPYIGNFMPPTPDLSFTGLDEFVNEPVVENCKAMFSEEEPTVVRKYDDAPSIEEWVSDDEEEDVSQPKFEKNNNKKIDGGYVAFGGNPKGGKITRKCNIKTGSTILTVPHHTPTIIPPSAQPQKKQKPRKPKIKNTQVPQPSDPIENVPDKAVHKELDDSLVRAATTASSLEAQQDNVPRNHRGTTVQTRFKSVSKHSNESLLARGNTLQSDEDSLKLDELMALCTTLQNKVLDLEKTTTTQRNEIDSLKRRVKKLENINRSRTHRLKRLYKVGLTARVESFGNEESMGEDASKQGMIDAIDIDEEITLVSVQDEVVSNDAEKEMFNVDVLDGWEVFVAKHEVSVKGVNDEVNIVEEVVEVIDTAKLIIDTAQDNAATTVGAATTTTTTITTVDDITLAQALKEIKSKGILIECVIEPVKPMKRKYQIRFDEESALKLQAAFVEKERLAREKAKKVKEANIALIETRDDI